MWTYISSSGSRIALTEGFYASKEASDLFAGSAGDPAHFVLTYDRDSAGYKFDLTITGAQYSHNFITD